MAMARCMYLLASISLQTGRSKDLGGRRESQQEGLPRRSFLAEYTRPLAQPQAEPNSKDLSDARQGVRAGSVRSIIRD